VPAIVSASAGVAEHYPTELARLLIADPDDTEELEARLAGWRADVDGTRTAVAPLSASLRRHTWDAMAEQIVGCLERAA
jgi:hypothetical protein